MENILQITLLFDFYGELLTEKQKLIFELYNLNDLSLSEIGDELNISRQAVGDQIRRAEKVLFNYEKKLGLVDKFLLQKKAVDSIKNIIDDIEKKINLNSEIINSITEIKRIINDNID